MRHMEAYLIPIKTAFLVFPMIAVLFTAPYLIIQYRNYGSISFLRSVILYSFILYLLCMYLLVILPLPSMEEVLQLTTPETQLRPFQFIRDFIRETKLRPGEPATYLPALKQNCFLQVVFNIFLFVPFGIYLNYYFKCSFRKVVCFSFFLSLFFELTQLTGLYGIYPRGYRLFDVDDLLLNSIGGIFGYPLGFLAAKLLPKREEIDRIAYEKGRTVSYGRRLTALFIDGFCFGAAVIVASMPVAAGGMVFGLYLSKGFTPGKWLLRIQVTDEKGKRPSIWQCMIRELIPAVGITVLPAVFLTVSVIDFIAGNRKQLFYERLSRTYCVSRVPQAVSKERHRKQERTDVKRKKQPVESMV